MTDPELNIKGHSSYSYISGCGLNPYFTAMLDAKRNNKESFKYNGQTYKRQTTSKGMVV